MSLVELAMDGPSLDEQPSAVGPAEVATRSAGFRHQNVLRRKRIVIFYGSQTGTAHSYAVRLAKDIRAHLGHAPLVCDLEQYDLHHLAKVSQDAAVIFVMATYGESDPTDNARAFVDESLTHFDSLEGLHYLAFGLGNKVYTHFNGVIRLVDERLQALGAQRIGQRGEGDDDNSLAEDYQAWADTVLEPLARFIGADNSQPSDTADFQSIELPGDTAHVFHGELSVRALPSTLLRDGRPTYDAKNPYPAPVKVVRDLFAVPGDRQCVHLDLDIAGSGMSYKAGDHVGVWPVNPDAEVARLLAIMGLGSPERQAKAVAIKALDVSIADVPFPQPATYAAIVRHYLDICSVPSRLTVAALARYAPSAETQARLQAWSADVDTYDQTVVRPALRLGDVLQLAATGSLETPLRTWNVPFDRLIALLPRLQPRYYSISSSPRLAPNSVHISAVVVRYKPELLPAGSTRWVHGLSTNFLLHIKDVRGAHGHASVDQTSLSDRISPTYHLHGPRGSHSLDQIHRVPVHIRRANFRLPPSPRIPVIMIGPGTGVAPFRGFVQDRVGLARKVRYTYGANALDQWAPIYLFYGCRRSNEDFLYKDEWPTYAQELNGKLQMLVAYSREPNLYVQDLIRQRGGELATLILSQQAHVYICGDAKGMAKAVEAEIVRILDDALGGDDGVRGAQAVQLLRNQKRLLLDVWS